MRDTRPATLVAPGPCRATRPPCPLPGPVPRWAAERGAREPHVTACPLGGLHGAPFTPQPVTNSQEPGAARP